ncbi:MAG: hypothetical protein O3A00_23875 [Planctomycetota bacterium]|nr:hypothetical protein [Planctomycetota bacterium]
MQTYEFTLVATNGNCPPSTDEEAYDEWMLDVADALAEQMGGRPDVTVGSDAAGVHLEFCREAAAFEDAVNSALLDIKAAGLKALTAEFA